MRKKLLPLLGFCLFAGSFVTSAKDNNSPASKFQYGFIENKGQIINQDNKPAREVLYLLNTAGLNVQLRKGGFSYDTYVMKSDGAIADKLKAVMSDTDKVSSTTYEFHRVDISLVGANENCAIMPEGVGNDYINYYTENGAQNVHHYERVVYKNIYAGIDLEFVASNADAKPVEYNFIVHPGGDASQIKMRYTGANDIRLENNAIVTTVRQGSFTETIPASYLASSREPVKVTYLQKELNTFGYNIPAYDKSQVLVIDPTPGLAWGTYYGGSSGDVGSGVAANGTSLYMVGSTRSSGSIATTGAHQSSLGAMADVFLVKLSFTGTRQWATYYGGAGEDIGIGVTAAFNGDVFISGQAASGSVFASSNSVLQNVYFGNPDGFIAKFNGSGTRQWGTYVGKNGYDAINSLAVDKNGDVAFAGNTSSDNMYAPGANRTFLAGSTDGFLGVIEGAGGTGVYFMTYCGSDNNDDARGIGVDGAGNVYVAGTAGQPISNNYIATVGCHQPYYEGGTTDMYLMSFDDTGALRWGTYYGGSNNEPTWTRAQQKLAVDAAGNVYIAGSTLSSNNIATSGGLTGADDGFIAKFNSNGVRQWGKYVGTTNGEALESIALDPSGNVYVSGFTNSISGIATGNAYQTSNQGVGKSVFAAKFNSSGTEQWATYIGGDGEEESYGIALDPNYAVYVCGLTSSTSGLATTGAHQTFLGGNSDAFLAKLNDCSLNSMTASTTQTPACVGQTNGTLTINVSGGYPPYEYKLGSGSFQSSNIFSGLSNASYTISLRDVNGCIASTNGTVNQAPSVTKPVIIGNVTSEELHSANYTTSAQTGATYQWTVTGGTIASGQSTNAIAVNWGIKGAAASVKVLVSQGAPCEDSAIVSVSLTPSGIGTITMGSDISVYPNPATEQLTVKINGEIAGQDIKLFDNYGKLLLKQAAKNIQTLNISALPAGVYHISIGGWNGNISKL